MDTKICSQCAIEKSIEDFHYRNKPKRDAMCKICKNLKIKDNYAANKERYIAKAKKSRDKARKIIDEMKNVPCVDCGRKFPPICMDFDHIQKNKIANVSHLVIRGNIQAAIDEAAKCEIVCACCHRIRTFISR